MNELVTYDFESHNVRMIVEDNGEPWFIAADVCAALTISTEQTRRLDDDEKGLRTVQTPGGQQEMVAINEFGLYNLILTSRKPGAKRFKKWVTHEVLPSIRKTGAYIAPHAASALPNPTQDRVAAIIQLGEAVTRVPGVKPGIAMAATLACIQENTGLTIEPLRRALPPANDPIGSLNPSQIGDQLGGLAAKAVNLRLRDMGLQFKNDRGEWELTEPGQTYAEAVPYSRNGHAGYQILWKPEVVDRLREVA